MGAIRTLAVGGRGLLPQAVRFLAAGAAATSVHYALLAALLGAGLLPPVPASCAGYAAAAALNYWLRRRLVFRSRRPHRRALPAYLAVLGAGFGLNAGIVALGVDLLGLPVAPVQVLATGLVLVWNFAGHRLWSFGGGEGSGGDQEEDRLHQPEQAPGHVDQVKEVVDGRGSRLVVVDGGHPAPPDRRSLAGRRLVA